MSTLTERLHELSSAEDYLRFFAVPCEPPLVQHSGRRILERFQQLLRSAEGLAGLDDIALYRRYRALLAQACRDLVQAPAVSSYAALAA